jgi:hypothetical protein
MWLIERHSDGRQPGRIPLPPIVRSALVRWYVGEGSRADEEAGITLIQQARIGEKWIACDCLPPDLAPPVLTPAFLSEAETYYLRRLTGSKRPEHLPDCPFFRDQATNRLSEIRSPKMSADPPSGLFEVLRPAPEALAQRPEDDSSDDRTRHASVPRLARLLWRLINVSGINSTPPIRSEAPDHSIRDEFHAITAAATKLEMAPGIELGRGLWTHANAFHSNRVYAGIRELARQWPGGHAPQGFLALFAKAFKGNVIYPADGDPISIANRVQSPSIRGNLIKGPYLVLVVVGEYPEARGYAPLRAYAQPIYSGQRFVPVDSEFEREVFRSLLQARSLLDGRSIDIAIEKPVFDILTDRGPCRPDFLLEARSRLTGEIRQLVVEAMGSSSDEYLASKAVTHPRMKRIAPILTVSPADADNSGIAGKIAAALQI